MAPLKSAASGAFSGFTSSTLYTPVPNPLFGSILEQIQDLAELKVTLRGLWLFHRKRTHRAVSLDEFLADRSLLKGLRSDGKEAEEEIRRGLRLAVNRGTFLTHRLDGGQSVFLLNTEAGRRERPLSGRLKRMTPRRRRVKNFSNFTDLNPLCR